MVTGGEGPNISNAASLSSGVAGVFNGDLVGFPPARPLNEDSFDEEDPQRLRALPA